MTYYLKLLPLLLLFIPQAKAESELDRMRYQLEMARAQVRDAQEQASRERGARMEAQRKLDAQLTRSDLKSSASSISRQVKANNDSAIERSDTLTEVSERAATAADGAADKAQRAERAADRSADKSQTAADKSQTIGDRQLTQIWIGILTALTVLIYAVADWLRKNKTHDLVEKVEINSNGHMAALIAAKDALLLTAKQSAGSLAASEAAHRALLIQQIEQLRRLGPAKHGTPAQRKPRRNTRNS